MRSPYVMPVNCHVCGGPGAATIEGSAAAWLGERLQHKDPKVCSSFLAERKRDLDRREAELKEQAGG